MKTATLRTFLAVHTWVGLVAGMALFIAFYAGAITMFEHEIAEWQRSDRADAAPRSPERAQTLVDALLARHPEAAHSFAVFLPGKHGPEPIVYWYETRAGGGNYRTFWLDEQGRLQDRPAREGFVEFIYDLHFTAGLPRPWGVYLFGVVCILYGLALVSGVVIYAPGFFKDLFALRLGRNVKRLWQDAHNVIGMLSLPFHVIFAWSGAVLTLGLLLLAPFQWLVFENKLLKVLGSDFEVAPHIEAANVRKPTLPIAELVARAQAALPGLAAERVDYHDAGDANARITIYGEVPQRRLSSLGAVALDGVSGETVRILQPREYSPGTAFLRGLQALHFGNFGHATLQWLYFVLGLAGAFLFYSGNLLWIEARRKRRSVAQPRRTRFVAGLTIGVCLGCVAGISAMFVANKLLPAELVRHGPWEQRVYFGVFLLAVVWAFLRRPARAASDLLFASAVLTAAIPVANAFATENPFWQTALRGQWAIFGVDIVALVMAGLFWRLGVATLRRGREGDPNSVWALPSRHRG